MECELPGGWQGEMEKLLFNGYRVSVLQDEKVLEIGCKQCEYSSKLYRASLMAQ